jgi:ribosomal protein S18 acetylase RimI-like enzyme
MYEDRDSLIIRPFAPRDANACYRIRREAYLTLFYDDLGAEASAAAIDSIAPSDFNTMAGWSMFFVAEMEGEPVGFCVYRKLDDRTVELLLLYVQVDRLRKGIGSALMSHAESWIREYRPEFAELVVDTVIPRYNQAFYEKHGFIKKEKRAYEFPDKTVDAVRLWKRLR